MAIVCDDIKALYFSSIKRFGATSHGVLWSNAHEQNRRFDILLDLLNIDSSTNPISINDYGCGYGALFRFLQYKKISLNKYYGYDMLPEMLEMAHDYIDVPKNPFVHLVLAEYPTYKADYTIISGTFNLCLHNSYQQWKEYIFERLLLAFAYSLKGVAFNGLDTSKQPKDDGLFYYPKEEFIEFCTYGLNAKVKSFDDETLHEWSIALLRA